MFDLEEIASIIIYKFIITREKRFRISDVLNFFGNNFNIETFYILQALLMVSETDLVKTIEE